MRLTPEQTAAVEHPGGPVLVLAGAGAGKTRVLSRRVAWLIDRGASPDEVLALTFTREAAIELRQRAEEQIGRSHETLRVSTFHSYAQGIVRVHGVERGLLPACTVASQEDRSLLLFERIGELDLRLHDLRGDRAVLVSDLIARIDACRDELVSADSYVRWAETALADAGSPGQQRTAQRQLEFAHIYRAHDRWLAEAGLEDFGLSLIRAIDLLRAHPDRLEAVRAGARHVLVDEFQDTNHAQSELLHLIGAESDSLMVVGDDDQGIYRFRGASTKNIADFRTRWPDHTELRLELNHRSGQAILDAAGAVVAPIEGRAAKHLVALPDAPRDRPRFWLAEDTDAQARAVVDQVLAQAAAGTPLEEQAILMRAVRTEARPITAALERAGVPHQVRGGVRLLERREVRSAIAWMGAVTDPRDARAHARIAAEPRHGLPWSAVADALASAGDGPVTGALAAVARAAGATAFLAALETIGRAAAQLAPADALRVAIDASGLRTAALALGGAQGGARLASLNGLERLGRLICERDPSLDGGSLAAMLTGLAELGFRGHPGAPSERIGVQVMTIHQAKGLEFDVVFVIGMTRAAFPGRNRPGGDIPDALIAEAVPQSRDAHIDEARRLAYVAMTRARRQLVLCAPEWSDSGAHQEPSPFLEEARAAVAGALEPVGEAPDRSTLREIGELQGALGDATLRAAQARAGAASDAAELAQRARAATDALIAAQAAVFAPPARPPVRAVTRPARPGLELTPSAITTYRGCPLRYRYIHVDRIPVPPGAQQRIGVAAHAALEAHYRPGGDAGAGERWGAGCAGELRRAGVADDAAARQTLALAREQFPAYHQRLLKRRDRPVAVERAFTLLVGPHRIHGRIDRVDALGTGGHGLIDYKTGRPPAGGNYDDTTMHLYLLGARDAWNVEAQVAVVEHIFDGTNHKVDPDGGAMHDALEMVREVADGIGARRFAPRTSWACHSCEFNAICPAIDR
ncbi:MAG TPA: ATP-dependent DNA helicase [Miltoncostaeaceae bacterium]|nr:ATP-dependent DNA helicase [Miltoncostaeaceae bacterium]